jgi:hypothetical protein
MKKIILILSLIVSSLFISKNCIAQMISFCESVKEDGQMVNPSSTYAMTKNGGIMSMLVTLDHKVGSEKIVYKVFRVSDKGDQTLDQTINDNVTPDWMWFYHELIIRSPGNYIVYVYPEGSTKVLASGLVHLIPAK